MGLNMDTLLIADERRVSDAEEALVLLRRRPRALADGGGVFASRGVLAEHAGIRRA